VSKALLLAVTLFSAACSATPFERGLELGREHAQRLKKGELTFERFARDLDRADERSGDARARDEFERGYAEATAPVRAELIEMVTATLATQAIDDLGATTSGMVSGIRASLEKDGELDREKIRGAGRKMGELMNVMKEGLDEFHRGMEEGLGEDGEEHRRFRKEVHEQMEETKRQMEKDRREMGFE
jgi:hypothetical protein